MAEQLLAARIGTEVSQAQAREGLAPVEPRVEVRLR